MKTQTLIQALAARLALPVRNADRKRARLHVLDWAGCAIAGAREPAGRILHDTSEAGSAATAFLWGGLGNILEMDDVDKRAILHPGPSIIPAVLALSGGAEDADILDAVVRGYEATIRLGRATGAGHYAIWHSTGTCGAIGAAAACASLLKLPEKQVAHALALALSQSAGLWQTRHEPGSMGKQLHTANAARAGVESARLAANGFAGPLSLLEGQQGFFAAMCPGADPENVLADYGPNWLIHQVSFKFWPACRHAHAAIDAALEAAGGVDLSSIQKVRVQTYADAIKFCDKPNPKTVIEAKFSLQHAVAVVIARGAPGLSDFSSEAIDDPVLANLRSKIEVSEGARYTAAYPAHFGSSVQIDADDPVLVEDAWGDPEHPISEDDLVAKAEALMEVGGASSEQISSVLKAAGSDTGTLIGYLREIAL
ncbi:MmgE/PrpD family protein [Hyphomonas sp.]|jgi:2-methylcitrate dehydratase PrpD|uniref:MmgE/PrpD family protein n=1 Tax=Hyphomonas sp. TaxID=87 RepID=UPI0035298567